MQTELSLIGAQGNVPDIVPTRHEVKVRVSLRKQAARRATAVLSNISVPDKQSARKLQLDKIKDGRLPLKSRQADGTADDISQ